VGALAELLKLGLKTAMKEADSSVSYTLKNLGNQPLKLKEFGEKQVKKYNLDSVIKDEDELPSILYHSTYSPKPFKEFDLKKGYKQNEDVSLGNPKPDPNKTAYEFLSTSSDPKSADRFGSRIGSAYKELTGKDPALRTLVGMGQVKKVFDFENKKHVNDLLNLFKKDLKKEGKTKKEIKQEIKDYKSFIEDGFYVVMESPLIQKNLKKLKFDSFTTKEGGKKNIMLFNPNEQFIPLFDPLKKNPIGYKKGGQLSSTLKQLSYR
jgi:hypothetical protein